MKQVEETKFAFSILNPLTVCGMIAGDAGSVFSNPVLAICLLAAYSILFVVFTLFKDNLFVSTIATSLLLLLDLKFAILLVADIVILIIHNSIEKPLKSTNGYPVFIDITVKYERFNKPKYINTDQYPHPENPNL